MAKKKSLKTKENNKILFDFNSITFDQNLSEEYLKGILKRCAKEFYYDILFHRAIPDVRDGLIDAKRRIVYTCHDNNWNSKKAHIKSARVIGDALGRFHPHSLDALYLASANMAQKYKNFICLTDFHGSSGTVSGEAPASMRYTEMRTSKECEKILTNNLKYNCYDKQLNFSQDEEEPVVMPSELPLYLINGAFGIAAGYLCSAMPHNPNDVLDACISRIKNKNKPVELLPSFPHPCQCEIINTEEVKSCYTDFKKYNKTNIKMRCFIEKDEERHKLHVTSCLYLKGTSNITVSIQEATKEQDDPLHKGKKLPPKITDISDIKDLTGKDKNGNYKVDIEITVKKDANLDVVKEQLYAYTLCQDTYPLKYIATKGEGNFLIFNNITEIVDEFNEFKYTTIKQIKLDLIKKNQKRIHIIDGMLKVLPKIDEIISKIKKSKNSKAVVKMLINDYNLTDIQAEYIADYKLSRLAQEDLEELKEEKNKLQEEIDNELEYFKNPKKLDEFVINDYEKYRPMFKNITNESIYSNITINPNDKVKLIEDEDFMIIFTKSGYVKKFYAPKSQSRGTKGISVGKLKDNDYVLGTFIVNSRDTVFIPTTNGMIYSMKVYDIPTCERTSLGYKISHIINEGTMVNMIPVKEEDLDNEDMFFIFATKNNKIKLVPSMEFKNVRNSGIMCCKLFDKDELLYGDLLDSNKCESIIALATNGNSIRVNLYDIPVSKRPTYGSNLFYSGLVEDGYCVSSVSPIREDKDYYFLITNNGLGKLMEKSEFEPQKRGTKGKMACKTKSSEDIAIKMIDVSADDEIIIVSNKNLLSVNVSSLSVVKRPTYGNKVKKLEEGEIVIDVAIK